MHKMAPAEGDFNSAVPRPKRQGRRRVRAPIRVLVSLVLVLLVSMYILTLTRSVSTHASEGGWGSAGDRGRRMVQSKLGFGIEPGMWP
jgi:hypothetical protein